MQNRLRSPLLVVTVFALFGTSYSGLRDAGTGPNGIAPTPDCIVAGGSTSIEMTLNQVSTTSTVISLSSSSSYFSVPATVTIPAGQTVGYVTGESSSDEPTETPTVTGTAGGVQVQCSVLVMSEDGPR